MARAIGAVVVAEVVWTAWWLGGSVVAQAASPGVVGPAQPLTNGGVLFGFLVVGGGRLRTGTLVSGASSTRSM